MSGLGLIWGLSVAIQCAYETFFIGKMGATPGKMALGLKVVRADGSPVDYARAAGRFFGKMLSGIILGIGYIMAGFDAQKRALHDMICDTRVIKARGSIVNHARSLRALPHAFADKATRRLRYVERQHVRQWHRRLHAVRRSQPGMDIHRPH